MDEPDIRVPDDCQIELVGEGKAGQDCIVPLQEWFDKELQKPDVTSKNAPRVLRITALTVQLKFEKMTWAERLNKHISKRSQLYGKTLSYVDGLYAVLPIREGITAMAYTHLDDEKDGNVPLGDDVMGLVLRPRGQPEKSGRKPHVILLVRFDERHYRRIGLVRVSHVPRMSPVTNVDPQTVYVDDKGTELDEIEREDGCPLWLQEAVQRTFTIA